MKKPLRCTALLVAAAIPPIAAAQPTPPLSPQTREQVTRLTQHLMSAFMMRNELRLDPKCSGRTYPELDLNQFVEAVPRQMLSASEAQQMRTEFPKMLAQLYTQTLPSGARTGQIGYQNLVQQANTAELPATVPREHCDRMFHVIRSGYDRILSDVRQLK